MKNNYIPTEVVISEDFRVCRFVIHEMIRTSFKKKKK